LCIVVHRRCGDVEAPLVNNRRGFLRLRSAMDAFLPSEGG